MAYSAATLRVRFPQIADLTAYPDTLVDAAIDEAYLQINTGACGWGSRADIAAGWLAMHLIALAPPSSGVGPGVASVTAGQASVSYWANSVVDKDSLLLTPYGREYARLRRLEGPGMRLVDDCECG